ncbi:MAG: hypothetical protein V4568_17970 [Pseudomonadota bacterium]
MSQDEINEAEYLNKIGEAAKDFLTQNRHEIEFQEIMHAKMQILANEFLKYLLSKNIEKIPEECITYVLSTYLQGCAVVAKLMSEQADIKIHSINKYNAGSEALH